MARRIDPERLKQFVRTEAAAYLDRPGVTSVGIGHRIRKGRRTEELCIQFSVDRKLRPEMLASEGRQPLPKSFVVDGVEIPTDVVERSFKPSYKLVAPQRIEKDPRKLRLDPIAPGCSVGHPTITAGTLGCIVYDQQDGTACLLSNWHVLHGPQGLIGDAVVQPGAHDDNRIERNRAGTLTRSHLGAAGDCAIARIEGRGFDPAIIGLEGARVEKLGIPEIGDRVVKSGRTTGVTHGVVTRIETTVKIDYGGAVGPQLVGGFEIGPSRTWPAPGGEISMGGDSGAAWLAADRRGRATGVMLGLHFAGEGDADPGEHAIACYAHAVFQKLEIGLDPPPRAELDRRMGIGYDPDFLGVTVPVPRAGARIRADLLAVNGTARIDHTHFSLAMSRSRKLARWVAWNAMGGG